MRYQLSILSASVSQFGKPQFQKIDIVKPMFGKENAEQIARILTPHLWEGDVVCVYDTSDDEVVYCNDKSLLEGKSSA